MTSLWRGVVATNLENVESGNMHSSNSRSNVPLWLCHQLEIQKRYWKTNALVSSRLWTLGGWLSSIIPFYGRRTQKRAFVSRVVISHFLINALGGIGSVSVYGERRGSCLAAWTRFTRIRPKICLDLADRGGGSWFTWPAVIGSDKSLKMHMNVRYRCWSVHYKLI